MLSKTINKGEAIKKTMVEKEEPEYREFFQSEEEDEELDEELNDIF